VQNSGEHQIAISVKYGNGGGSKTKQYASTSNNCSISLVNPEFDLQIPCPLPNGTKKLRVNPVTYSQNARQIEAPYIQSNSSNCSLDVLEPTLSIQAPCPLNGLTLTPKPIIFGTGDDQGELTIAPSSSGCNRNFDFTLKMPSMKTLFGGGGGGGGGSISCDVISGITFTLNGPGGQKGIFYKLKKKNICTGEEKEEDELHEVMATEQLQLVEEMTYNCEENNGELRREAHMYNILGWKADAGEDNPKDGINKTVFSTVEQQ
jgi:hypothetical protein